MLNDTVTRSIRTAVPIGVGALLTWLAATLHIVLSPSSEAALTLLATAVVSTGYYELVTLLEKWQPLFGVLLGVPAKPTYNLGQLGQSAASGVVDDGLAAINDLLNQPGAASTDGTAHAGTTTPVATAPAEAAPAPTAAPGV